MILDFDLYKNRELESNVKDKDTGSREMDAECAVLDAGYRAEEFNAPPEISAGAFLADRFAEKARRLVLPCQIIRVKYFIRISKGCKFN